MAREFDQLGASVAIDGDTAVVGAPDHGENRLGKLYVASRDPMTGGWRVTSELVPSTAEEFDQVGTSVAISGDNIATAASGAFVSYLFRRSEDDPGVWVEVGELDARGEAIAMNDDWLLVGDPRTERSDRHRRNRGSGRSVGRARDDRGGGHTKRGQFRGGHRRRRRPLRRGGAVGGRRRGRGRSRVCVRALRSPRGRLRRRDAAD